MLYTNISSSASKIANISRMPEAVVSQHTIKLHTDLGKKKIIIIIKIKKLKLKQPREFR